MVSNVDGSSHFRWFIMHAGLGRSFLKFLGSHRAVIEVASGHHGVGFAKSSGKEDRDVMQGQTNCI